MALRISLSLLSVSVALLFVSTSANIKDRLTDSGPFSYRGANGPDKWGSLKPEFRACSNGQYQSPVDINKDHILVRTNNLKCLEREYKSANATLVDNGFNIQVRFDGDVGGINEDAKIYYLKQIHWHSPSEHRINGAQTTAELHLFHQAKDGSMVVVAVLFEAGDPDPFISTIGEKLDELAKEVYAGNQNAQIALGTLDVKHLKKKTRKCYRYVGSLTTPPCTENVSWVILGKVRSISPQQLDLLRAPLDIPFKNNSRPLQPLNGRHIELYREI